MLKDSDTFSKLEKTLRNNGSLGLFEEEQGLIRRRMMITRTGIPEELRGRDYAAAFEASFDFSDTTLSIALDTVSLAPLSSLWLTKQSEDAQPPGKDAAEEFIHVLLEALGDVYGFSLPVYAFLSDFGHYIICPGR